MSDKVTVIQADRDLLKSLMALVGNDDVLCNRIDLGLAYVGEVEEIARHRIAHEPKWLPIEGQLSGENLLYYPPIPAPKGRIGHGALYQVESGQGGPFRHATHYQPLPTPPEQAE